MFANNIQPSLLSLFSSVGSDPLSLFSTHTDPDLRADSHITLIHDDSNLPVLENQSLDGKDFISPEDTEGIRGNIVHPVLSIQSPTLATTYIRSPPSSSSHQQLGIKLRWLHIQVRNLGRPWSIELGIVDPGGRSGVVRCSTFQARCFLVPRVGYSLAHVLVHISIAEASCPLSLKPTLASYSTLLPPSSGRIA